MISLQKRPGNRFDLQGNIVDWYTTLWFPQAIPRASFITWIVIRNRLPTGDRISMWGERVIHVSYAESLLRQETIYFLHVHSPTLFGRYYAQRFYVAESHQTGPQRSNPSRGIGCQDLMQFL